MKTTRSFTLLAFLLLAAPNLCFAMMEIAYVSKAEAKEMGMEVRAMPAGPDAVRVEVEFPTKGVLQTFSRADLEFSEGGKFLVWVSLREERPKPGRVMVSFAADRAKLERITVRLVTGVPMNMTGYELRLKDLVDLEKLR